MSDLKRTARQAGLLYLVFALIAILGEFLFPRFVVIGDAATTARNIIASESMFRLSIVVAIATHLLFILTVAALYELLRDVDRPKARLMVLFVITGVAMAFGNLVNKIAPLVLLSGSDYLATFSKPQLEALALAFLRIHSGGAAVTMIFWGLWLLPFGALVFKSRFLPRVLGVLLWIAGAAYIVTSVIATAAPQYRAVVTRFAFPLYMGEVPVILWLAIKGATSPKDVGSGDGLKPVATTVKSPAS